ncbi:hypothetical protein OG948_34790 (plasmid) [Embleya sp. NBC_00888]|uniref:hypothetical protein n=1 Tax=Embleya sp. NBC_00888 TaxID=2975960 RepID=UPI002F90ADF3|nr:hypothetical protein OG948_34790 [Embleya sp. NBC_00888]
MKRTDLVRELEALGAVLTRHGGNYDIYELKGQSSWSRVTARSTRSPLKRP